MTERATPAAVAQRTAADFRAGGPVRIGAELEWLVFDRDDPNRTVTAAETAATAIGGLPGGGTVTIEPGGQLEVATVPAPDPMALVELLDLDTRVLVERFDAAGLLLVPLGLDPIRPAVRSLDVARYEEMERYFSMRTPAGVQMMARTASLQLNVDFGDDPATTWRRAHRLAPLLAATFANSPYDGPCDGDGEPLPVSHRQRIWADTDASRSATVGDRIDDWHRYVLDAQVMLRGGEAVGPAEALTLAEWLADDDPPSPDELEFHLTTLFPPLRPRGYLELRMIDALPSDGRVAAIACVWALLADPAARELADALGDSTAGRWEHATRHGLGDPTLRDGADRMLTAVAAHVRPTRPALARACDAWRAHVAATPVAMAASDLAVWCEPIDAQTGGPQTSR